MRHLLALAMLATVVAISCDAATATGPEREQEISASQVVVMRPDGGKVVIMDWGIRVFAAEPSEPGPIKPVVDILNGPSGEIWIRNADNDVVHLGPRGVEVFGPGAIYVGGKQVVGERQFAIPDADGEDELLVTQKAILSVLRKHGLIDEVNAALAAN